MSLIYIQQRSYHYVILCVDGSVLRCLYLSMDGSGMAVLTWYVRYVVFIHMYMYCVNETLFELGLVVFYGLFSTSSSPFLQIIND